MLTEKTGSCDMQEGFRLAVNPLNQQGIFKAQGTTYFAGTIICATTKEEIEQWCIDNDVTLPEEIP